MTRLIVYFNGQYININADRLEEDERYLRGYRAGDLVAIFDIGAVDAAYLSQKKEDEA